MTPTKIIAGVFVNKENKILILKRTEKRRSFPGKWNFLSAIIEKGETPKDCLIRETTEEIGDIEYEIVRQGEAWVDKYKEGDFLVYPFLCKFKKGKIKLDRREHDALKWISVSDLDKYDHIPGMKGDLEALGLL